MLAGTEACDDGNASNNDGCTTSCVAARCGDGFVQNGVEGCDDSNTANNDGCNSGCLVENLGSCNVGSTGMTGSASCASGLCDTSETPDRCEPTNACGNGLREGAEA
ncbi:MAG: DUF4215 domain-containing protein, partial [bacterium]